MVAYPALFMPEDDGGFSVIFRDLPEANAFGDDLERTLVAAMYVVDVALEFGSRTTSPGRSPHRSRRASG